MLHLHRKKILYGSVAVVLILGALLYWLFRTNPQVAKVKEMRRALLGDASRKISPQERREKFELLRKEQEKLTAGERKEIGAEARKARRNELNRYFTLSKAEKAKWLDQRIDQAEAMRRESQTAGATGNAFGFGPGRNGGSGQSPADRERWRKEMLDSTTPEERAQMDQLRKDMQARRAQRGLPNTSGGWGGRP
jgi:hypothetical protein